MQTMRSTRSRSYFAALTGKSFTTRHRPAPFWEASHTMPLPVRKRSSSSSSCIAGSRVNGPRRAVEVHARLQVDRRGVANQYVVAARHLQPEVEVTPDGRPGQIAQLRAGHRRLGRLVRL